jgi:mutator protein MutT
VKELTTTLVFLVRDNQILLAMKKRGFGAGHWNGVGGKVDPDETIEQAMIRECQEEISVTPTTYHQAALNIFHEFYKGEPHAITVHTYLCSEWTGEPEESEEMAPKWFAVSDIPYDQMWPDDEYWLPPVLDGKLVRTTFRYNNTDAMESHEITEVQGF